MILNAFTLRQCQLPITRDRSSVAGWNNISTLDHQDHCAFRRACSMTHASRHNEALSRREIDYAILEIDQKPSIKHEKEFIDVIVFMPVIFALNDRHSHD
jgi:hypothetical protein